MDVFEAIKKRRSIRVYKPDPIPEAILNKLLVAMQLSPSGGNYQPRRFIIVRDHQTRMKLSEAGRSNPQSVVQAPVVVVGYGAENDAIARYVQDGQVVLGRGDAIAAEIKNGEHDYENCLIMDIVIALDHLTLAAAAEGLGTCWIGAFNEQKVKDILHIPPEMHVPIIMPVGYPAVWPEPKPRKALAEIVQWEHA